MPCAVLALCAGLSERERNSTFKLLSSSSSPAVHPQNYTLNLKYDLSTSTTCPMHVSCMVYSTPEQHVAAHAVRDTDSFVYGAKSSKRFRNAACPFTPALPYPSRRSDSFCNLRPGLRGPMEMQHRR